jgi:hypothetical protein
MFSGNDGLHGFIIGNPKHLEGPRGHGGLGGFEPPLLDLMVVQQKSCPPFWPSLYAH